jgi:hypothetical protein
MRPRGEEVVEPSVAFARARLVAAEQGSFAGGFRSCMKLRNAELRTPPFRLLHYAAVRGGWQPARAKTEPWTRQGHYETKVYTRPRDLDERSPRFTSILSR